MIRVREAVRACACRGHDGTLLEQEDRASGTRQREHARDRVDPFAVCDGVLAALGDTQLHSLFGRDARKKVGPFWFRAPKLEVWRTWSAERASAEQGAAEVRTATAGARDDATRWAGERREPRAEDSGLVQNLDGVLVTVDVELVTRPAVEGAALVRPDLGRDTEAAQQAEGPPGNGRLRHVQVDGNLTAATQVDAAGGVEEPGQLRQTVALVARRDRRELAAQILRE